MAKIDNLAASLNGLLPVIEKIVCDWKPPKFKSEVSYRDNLLAHLREVLPDDAKVEKEFLHRGTTMDLWIGWKSVLGIDELAFRLKLNLKKKSNFDRLIGQIEGLEPRNNKIMVVLIGDTDQAFLGRVRDKYVQQIKATAPTLSIVLVPVTEQ